MNETAQQVRIAILERDLSEVTQEFEKLSERMAKIEAAIGWVIAAGTALIGFITAARAGVFKWLGGLGG